jgi:hypothetical protein
MISPANMKRIADLTAQQARERTELALKQANDVEELITRQRAERETLSKAIGVPVDERPAAAAGPVVPASSSPLVLPASRKAR